MVDEILYRTKPVLKKVIVVKTIISSVLSIFFYFSLLIFLKVVSEKNLTTQNSLIILVVVLLVSFLEPIIVYLRLHNKEYLFRTNRVELGSTSKFVYYSNISDVYLSKKNKLYSGLNDVIIKTGVGHFKLEKLAYATQVKDYLLSLVKQSKEHF